MTVTALGTSVVNPSTGELITTLAPVGSVDVAVERALRAVPAWAADPDQRRAALATMAVVITENADRLARTLSLETGVPLRDTLLEVGGAAAFAQHRATTPLRRDVIHDDARQSVVVVRRPIGVVGAILPWNAPLMVGVEKVSCALAVGNTVIVKPSPLAPLAVLLLAELLTDHLPDGVLQVLVGGNDVGVDIVRHPGIGMISFTGSTQTGRAIMADAAPRLKRLSLELGGNDAAIVLPDVDVAKVAAKLFTGAFYRTGQVCAAIKRLYVHADVHADLVDAIATIATSTPVGDPFDDGIRLGPVSNPAQRGRVADLVDSARTLGGAIVTGGGALDRPGTFYAPTVVTGLAESAPLVAQEQFGPALPVQLWRDVDEVVHLANDSDFGLGASVWSTDPDRATALGERLEAGSVWVNRHGVIAPDVPFGGVKQSGVGRANGDVGVDAYSEPTTISIAKNRPRTTPGE